MVYPVAAKDRKAGMLPGVKHGDYARSNFSFCKKKFKHLAAKKFLKAFAVRGQCDLE